MAETSTPPAPEPEPAPAPEPTPEPEPAPTAGANARIRELAAEKKAAEDRATDFEKRLKEIEDRDLSDKERAEKRAEEAEERASAAEQKLVKNERKGWARDAAAEAQFIDPTDALAQIDLEATDTEAKVRNAIKKLAEDKPHLIRKAPAAGFGNAGGSPPSPAADPNADPELAAGAELFEGLFGGAPRR